MKIEFKWWFLKLRKWKIKYKIRIGGFELFYMNFKLYNVKIIIIIN